MTHYLLNFKTICLLLKRGFYLIYKDLKYSSHFLSTGAQLLFKFGNNSSFNLNSFREKVRDVVLHFSTQKKPVDFHVSRTFHDTIQVVLVEQGQYEGYVEELVRLILNMVESSEHLTTK